MTKKDWYVIAYCERENAYGEMIPAEWFILNAPYATREEAEESQARTVENTKGTDAEWPEANESAKIVHRDELAQYGLKPMNEENEETALPEKILCPGCGWEYPPEKMQNFTTKVNHKNGTQEELLFCDPVCTDFWDETEPGEWVPLGTVWPVPGREGQEVQLTHWTCSVCSGVYDCNMVKLLVDTDWNNDKLHVCSFCEKKEKGRYQPES